MSTQGLVTISDDRGVVAKIIAGCDGMEAAKIAAAVRNAHTASPEPFTAAQLLQLASAHGFGCKSCLIVMTRNEVAGEYGEEELDPRYRATFDQPLFNPRWESGQVEYFAEWHLPDPEPDPRPIVDTPCDIPYEQWEFTGDGNELGDPKTRMLASILLCGVAMHVEAIQVETITEEDGSETLKATDETYQDTLEHIMDANGCGDFGLFTINHPDEEKPDEPEKDVWRSYVLWACPTDRGGRAMKDPWKNHKPSYPKCPECGSTGPRCKRPSEHVAPQWHVAREDLVAEACGCEGCREWLSLRAKESKTEPKPRPVGKQITMTDLFEGQGALL